MKRSEIQVGTDYAIGRPSGTWRERVRVTGPAVVKQVKVRGSFYDTRKAILWPVTNIPGGETHMIESREFVRTWESHAAAVKVDRERRRDHDQVRREAMEVRVKSLLDLVPALHHAGVADSDCPIYEMSHTAGMVGMVETHCPELLTMVRNSLRLTAPLAHGLVDYIESGKDIPVPAALLLEMIR